MKSLGKINVVFVIVILGECALRVNSKIFAKIRVKDVKLI